LRVPGAVENSFAATSPPSPEVSRTSLPARGRPREGALLSARDAAHFLGIPLHTVQRAASAVGKFIARRAKRKP